MGATLFERSTRHVALTPAGEALLETAETLVAVSENARQSVRNAMNGETGRVRLGFAGASINRQVGQIARSIRAVRPGISLELHSSQFSHLGLQRVLDESLDLVIGRWDYLPPAIESSVIAMEEPLLAVPDNHPLAGRERLSMGELAEESWITLPGGAGAALQNRLNSLAMTAGYVPRVVQTAPDSWTLVVLVGAGMGCSLTLDSVRDNIASEGVTFIPLAEGNQPMEVRMIWRATDDSPALRAVVDLAGRIFTDPREDAHSS